MAFIHPLVILAAVICGIYTGTLGWKRFQFKRGKAPASAFPWQRHIRWGRRFIILLCIGSLIGIGYVWYKAGPALATGLHDSVGILILILFSIGASLGLLLSKKKGTDRLASVHMGINYGTFIIVAVQIVLGVLLLTFFYSG
jgi:Mn2+/Fe2+ NRAMP family transporter